MKSKEQLDSFIKYCKEHPEYRFWQSIRNWSGYLFIYGEYYNEDVDDNVLEDTFYKE